MKHNYLRINSNGKVKKRRRFKVIDRAIRKIRQEMMIK